MKIVMKLLPTLTGAPGKENPISNDRRERTSSVIDQTDGLRTRVAFERLIGAFVHRAREKRGERDPAPRYCQNLGRLAAVQEIPSSGNTTSSKYTGGAGFLSPIFSSPQRTKKPIKCLPM